MRSEVIVKLTPQLITDCSSFFKRNLKIWLICNSSFYFFNGQFQGYDPGGKERKRINSLPLKFPLRNNAFFFLLGRFYCASISNTDSTFQFHGDPRVWDGKTIRRILKGNSALYIVMPMPAKEVYVIKKVKHLR